MNECYVKFSNGLVIEGDKRIDIDRTPDGITITSDIGLFLFLDDKMWNNLTK